MQAKLWNPQVAFYKVKTLKHTQGFGYEKYSFFQYNENKNSFIKSQQLVMKVPCSFNFHTYPFDKHQCNIQMYELRYKEAVNITITKFYSSSHFSMNDEVMISSMKLPFKVFGLIGKSERYPYHGVIVLTIKRDSLDLLLGPFYIPTGIFATLSIGSYVISPEVVPGRMGLLITTYLIASNVYGSLDAPPSRGFSNIEVWITGVQCNILLAIVEYLFILCLMRSEIKLPFGFSVRKCIKIIDAIFFTLSLAFLISFNYFYWTSVMK